MEFLIKRFIKNSDKTSDASVRTAYGKFSSIIGIFFNLILFVGKFIAGTLSGSVSITADAVNNLSDASSSIISLFGFKMASKPADAEHPYGHGRYEYLSAMMVAVLIMTIGLELLKSSFDKIINPSPVEFSWLSVAILVFSIAVKLRLMAFNTKIGKRISSQTLIATAADSRNDVISTAAVIAAAIISEFTSYNLDGWIGLAVAAFILISGFGLIKDTINPMLGKAPDDEFVQKIHEKIMSYDGVLGTHDLMIHDYGPGRLFASVHVEMAGEADVFSSHDVIDNIEQDFLRDEKLNIIVHFDPILTEDSTTNDMRHWLSKEVKNINPKLSVHDLRIVPGPTHTNLIFDCVLPFELELTESELKELISDIVSKTHPDYNCVITVDKSYAAMPH